MDNNEAREMDYADTATGPDPFDIDPTGAGWIISEEFYDLDHCTACGFDLGTHRPTCPRAYDVGNYGNPNRPTEPDHCFNCDTAPCIWIGYRTDTVLKNRAATCKTAPRPITLQEHMIENRTRRIDALTDDQRRTDLMFLTPDELDAAIRYATR